MKHYKNLFLLILFTFFIAFTACKKENQDEVNNLLQGLGWFGSEDTTHIPNSLYLGSGNNPASINLLGKFPPIGNQGSYGTCVAWSTGYNFRTYLNAVKKNLSSSELNSASNQFSPKDLFWAIDESKKGSDCNGTNFESALDVLVSRGVTTLANAPYDDLGNCSTDPPSNWTSDAANYKIENYRDISINVGTIKDYLAQNRPVIIGAKLGENFMGWNSDAVLTTDGTTYQGQHANHAMILSGYDDSKGPRGAFRVVNSWGTSWGDNGYIWIDYDFFCSTFCFAAFVGADDNNIPPDTNNTVTGWDLVGWELEDIQNPNIPEDPLKRACLYNVYNEGSDIIPASKDWAITYLYYNAYDANDYGILIYDYYSNDYGSPGEDGDLTSSIEPDPAKRPGICGNWYNYFDIPGGSSVFDVWAQHQDPPATGTRFSYSYTMPSNLNGSYYLVLIADGFDVVPESDETNNYLYYSQSNGDPLEIINGEIQGGYKSKLTNMKTVVNYTHRNAYSPKEITQFLIHQKNTGELQKKMMKFKKDNNNIKTVSK
jgi:hypothetical protein